MVEHVAELAVDAAVALVDDDQVEVAGRVVAVLVDHRLQRADRDLLVRHEALAGARHAVGRQRRQVLGERILGLLGQRVAVDQEQGAGDPVGVEQPLDQGGRHPRLAGPGRHLDQQLAPAQLHLLAQHLDAGALVVAARDPPVHGDAGRRHPQRPGRDPPLQVLLAEHGGHRAEVRVAVQIAEPHLLAVGQEHERHAEPSGVGQRLRLRRAQAHARLLGFQHRQRLPAPVAQDVVGLGPVTQPMLEPDAPPVGQLPARILELRVDLDPRKCFVPTHGSVVPASPDRVKPALGTARGSGSPRHLFHHPHDRTKILTDPSTPPLTPPPGHGVILGPWSCEFAPPDRCPRARMSPERTRAQPPPAAAGNHRLVISA